jgi:methyltransferase (TIGR00027 family)
MRSDRGSDTAVFAAVLRAAHQVLDSKPLILNDPIAIGLVSGAGSAEIRQRADEFQTTLAKLVRSAVVFRSRFAEDELSTAAVEGVAQYVVLGAGYDTFAYRQPPWAGSLRVIEVDHPGTQEAKQARLASNSVSLPTNLTFCPVDFERRSLEEGLQRVGFHPARPTFFSWLGVTQYLTWASMEKTLRFVARLPPLSRISFSFVLPDAAVPSSESEALEIAASRAESRGEPWLTRFESEPLSRYLGELGFSSVFHLTPDMAHSRYFEGRSDALPTPVYEQMVTAQV